MLDIAYDVARALQSNHPEFPDSPVRRLSTLGEDAFQVLVHGRHGNPEQLGDQGLTQPDYVGLEAALDARAAVLGLVEDDAGFRRSVVGVVAGEAQTGPKPDFGAAGSNWSREGWFVPVDCFDAGVVYTFAQRAQRQFVRTFGSGPGRFWLFSTGLSGTP